MSNAADAGRFGAFGGQYAPETLMPALLALEAAKRLVPSTNQRPEDASAAYAVARYLYSNGAINAAK